MSSMRICEIGAKLSISVASRRILMMSCCLFAFFLSIDFHGMSSSRRQRSFSVVRKYESKITRTSLLLLAGNHQGLDADVVVSQPDAREAGLFRHALHALHIPVLRV